MRVSQARGHSAKSFFGCHPGSELVDQPEASFIVKLQMLSSTYRMQLIQCFHT
jgi:hypothetical protein